MDHDQRIRRTRSLGTYFSGVTATTNGASDSNGIIHFAVLIPKHSAEVLPSKERESASSHPFEVLEISQLQPEDALDLRSELGLGTVFYILSDPLDQSFRHFDWLPNVSECDQRNQILTFLRELVPKRVDFKGDGYEELFVEDASKSKLLLCVDDKRLPFGLRGTADVAVVDKFAISQDELLAGTRAVFMVRMSIGPSHKAQAFAQLVAINLTESEDLTPVVVLTDLNGN